MRAIANVFIEKDIMHPAQTKASPVTEQFAKRSPYLHWPKPDNLQDAQVISFVGHSRQRRTR